MTIQRPRRFWKQATVVDHEDGCGIALDGRPVKAPSKRDLRCPTRALAEAVAAEWNAQGEHLKPETMPLTQLANTAWDRVPAHRAEIEDELLRHVEADVLVYHADGPDDLVARQTATWAPLRGWAAGRFGVSWATGCGILPVSQDAAVHDAMAAAVRGLDDVSLTALQVVAPLCSSMILGFALLEGRVTAGEAFAAAFVDELYQAEAWGEDAEAAARRARLRAELEDVARFLELARTH